VAELAVAEFADACTVFLVDPTATSCQRVAAASADQSRAELFGEFPVGFRLDPRAPCRPCACCSTASRCWFRG
jgi:hypothetical protein